MLRHLEDLAAWLVVVSASASAIAIYLWFLAWLSRMAAEAGREHAGRHLTIVELKRLAWTNKPEPKWDAQLIQQSHRMTSSGGSIH